MKIYARPGEVITCENGHEICEFLATVFVGVEQKVKRELGKWRYPEPQLGTPAICPICGAPWCDENLRYHIGDSWRGIEGASDVQPPQ